MIASIIEKPKLSGEEHDQTIKLVLKIEVTAMQDNWNMLFRINCVELTYWINSEKMELFSEYDSYNSLSESSMLFPTYKAVKAWTIDSM